MSNEVLSSIAKRSSARSYSDEDLTKEQIGLILEAGLQGPTGMNKQEIHFTVVKGDNPVLDELDAEKRRIREQEKGEHNFFYEAPELIILSADKSFRWNKVDSGIAVENMAVAAESLGLGSLIIGCVYDALHGEKRDYFSKQLKFPEGYEFEIALAVGHKKDNKNPHEYKRDSQITIL